MLRKRIKKNTLKWKKIYAEQLLDMMDEEGNALQKIYLTGYVLELKKNRYFAGWYKDRIVCRSLEYARYFPSAEAAEEYVHKYLGFAGMTCYICHVNWTLASCGSENMEDNEENLLEENGKILSFTNYADVKQYQKQRGMEHSTMAITYARNKRDDNHELLDRIEGTRIVYETDQEKEIKRQKQERKKIKLVNLQRKLVTHGFEGLQDSEKRLLQKKLNAEQLEELNLQHREYVQRKHENQYQQMTLFAAENEGEDGNE